VEGKSSEVLVLFSTQTVARVPAIVAQRHDSHAIEFLVKQQVIGKLLKIGASPATGIEMMTLRISFHLEADFLKFRPKIVTQRIADRVIVPDCGGYVASDLGVKTEHQCTRSDKTPARNSSMEMVPTSPDLIWRTLSATSSSGTS